MRYFRLAMGLGVLAAGCAAPPPPAPLARLVRIELRAGDCSQFLDVDELVEPAPDPSAPSFDAAACLRTYSIVAPGPNGADVLLCDACGGPAVDPLLARCRAIALASLRKSMGPPRKPLDWHFIALASFLDASPPVVTSAERAALLAQFAASSDASPLAEAIVANASRFEPAELAPYARHEKLAPGLAALVRSAGDGDTAALTEVFRLSLEYHGKLRLFEAAARALFPEKANAGLWSRHLFSGPDSGAGFITEAQSRLAAARRISTPGFGWTLEAGA